MLVIKRMQYLEYHHLEFIGYTRGRYDNFRGEAEEVINTTECMPDKPRMVVF